MADEKSVPNEDTHQAVGHLANSTMDEIWKILNTLPRFEKFLQTSELDDQQGVRTNIYLILRSALLAAQKLPAGKLVVSKKSLTQLFRGFRSFDSVEIDQPEMSEEEAIDLLVTTLNQELSNEHKKFFQLIISKLTIEETPKIRKSIRTKRVS